MPTTNPTQGPTDQPGTNPEREREPGQPGEHEREPGKEAAPTNPQQPHQPTDHQGEAKPKARSLRGFAAMDAERQRAIASKGGQSQGKANNPGNFANDRQKAREAGRKGGQA